MVFTRTSASEIVKNIFSVFFILLAIISATQIVRFLGYAAKGQLSNDSVFFLFSFGMLRYSSEILCFSVFLGLVMYLTRLYRDSEMIIWNLYGISQKKFIKVILIITFPLEGLITSKLFPLLASTQLPLIYALFLRRFLFLSITLRFV